MSHRTALERFDHNEWESGENLVYIYLHKMNGADFENRNPINFYIQKYVKKLLKSLNNH